MMAVSIPHVTAIETVLFALPETIDGVNDPLFHVAHCILILEDAMMALMLGGQLGLSLASIRAQHRSLVAEFTAEAQDASAGKKA